MIAEGWNGFKRAAHGGCPVSAAWISASCPGGGRPATSPASLRAPRPRAIKLVWLLGADEIDTGRLGDGLRRLSGPSRRPRRSSCRRHPAGCRLHSRRNGTYVKHRGPGAAGRGWRYSPPGNARARTGRSCAPSAPGVGRATAVRIRWTRCAGTWRRWRRSSPPSTCRPRRIGPRSASPARRTPRPSEIAGRQFLHDRPDLPRPRRTMALCVQQILHAGAEAGEERTGTDG